MRDNAEFLYVGYVEYALRIRTLLLCGKKNASITLTNFLSKIVNFLSKIVLFIIYSF